MSDKKSRSPNTGRRSQGNDKSDGPVDESAKANKKNLPADFVRRGLLKSGWIVPTVIAVNLPAHGQTSPGPHEDVAHVDTHTDTHTDDSHQDTHGDDPGHFDIHQDTSGSGHGDHGDTFHIDFPGLHFDAHVDQSFGHSDLHGDISHTDTHADTHNDEAHTDA